MSFSFLDYQLRGRAHKNQRFKVSIYFLERVLLSWKWIFIFHLKRYIPTPISPPFLSCSILFCIASVCSILRPCLLHCVLQTGPCLASHSVVWTYFGTSAPSLPLPQFWKSSFHTCLFSVSWHKVLSLCRLLHIVDFPVQQSQMAYSSTLSLEKQGPLTSLETGLPSLNALKHLSYRNNI